MHPDAGCTECNFRKWVPDFCDVFQGQISSEADRIIEECFGLQCILRIVCDKRQVQHAVLQFKLFSCVLPMTGPVKGDHSVCLMLRQILFRKTRYICYVLAAAVSVCTDNDTIMCTAVLLHQKAAADGSTIFVDINMFFFHECPVFPLRCIFLKVSEKHCITDPDR